MIARRPAATPRPLTKKPRNYRRRRPRPPHSRRFICHPPAAMPKERRPAKSSRRRLRVVASDGIRIRPQRRRPNGPVALRKEEVTLHGRRVAYRTGGWGPLLVLIHGITSNSATWDRVPA